MTVELISSPPVLAAGNWVWLLAPPRQERALVIAPEQDALAGVISPHFTGVSRIAPEGSGRRLPAPDASIDLVAISRLEECAPGEIAWLSDTVRESRRVLREGGCMLVTFVNPFWARRYLRGWGPERLVTRGSVLAELEAAGFGRLASYYIQPFPEAASSIIPTWAPAAVQHERMEHMSSALGRYRPFAARIGAHALLYPGCACVGYV